MVMRLVYSFRALTSAVSEVLGADGMWRGSEAQAVAWCIVSWCCDDIDGRTRLRWRAVLTTAPRSPFCGKFDANFDSSKIERAVAHASIVRVSAKGEILLKATALHQKHSYELRLLFAQGKMFGLLCVKR